MYFPYLRGRQFELIALRELLNEGVISDKIIPIIEPIKPTPTLIKTLEIFSNSNKSIALIMNPNVGGFLSELRSLLKNSEKELLVKSMRDTMNKNNIIKSYIMNSNAVQSLNKMKNKKDALIISTNVDAIDHYLDIYNNEAPRFTLIPSERVFKRAVKENRVLISDKFNKLDRNVDYSNNDDEFFSNDHIYFSEEGYEGFSDYSVVGDQFSESGFAPLAVAIHIVYFDSKKNLRVRHFVSDSNEDISDPAGKFGEALEKLVIWIRENKIERTIALKKFEEYYKQGKYPGLGTVKKLAIMHHIELINRYLEGKI